LGFTTLYLNGKLKAWGGWQPRLWVVLVVLTPVIGAGLISCSVLVDNAHHPHDVVVGIGIGVLAAFAAYRTYYAAIWDWRFNHVPLQPGKDFGYDVEKAKTEGILVKRPGWRRSGEGDKKTGLVVWRSPPGNGPANTV
jgi:membrane-associated phospholipid phosphatase